MTQAVKLSGTEFHNFKLEITIARPSNEDRTSGKKLHSYKYAIGSTKELKEKGAQKAKKGSKKIKRRRKGPKNFKGKGGDLKTNSKEGSDEKKSTKPEQDSLKSKKQRKVPRKSNPNVKDQRTSKKKEGI